MQNPNFESLQDEFEPEKLLSVKAREINVNTNLKPSKLPIVDDTHSQELKEIGVSNEIAKSSYRGRVLFWLAGIITIEIIFLNFIFYKMVFNKTFISDTAFKYFISGIFVNLIMMFKAIMNYLYNNSTSSLIDLFFGKNKN